ncbi:murein biosynthesis integral membrane protein MurJ [Paraburkholderia metrosideri]|uniref:murein biosynthesis integral membrane protein MurJ n=1 Tax=Paraburkholderia metrosideri TaxID=580937 RepID=UPI001EFF3525|nr:lipid II flippase MurJ [Paraburkholderia metrosideri]
MLHAHPDHLRIARNAARVSLFVLLGRCAGALKEVAVAYRYGVSNTVDAYQFTLTLLVWLPSALASVLAIVLVPVLVELRTHGKRDQARFLGELEVATAIVGTMLTLALYLLWPVALHAMAGNLSLQTREMTRQLMLGMAPVGVLTLVVCVYAARLQVRDRHISSLLESMPAAATLVFVLCASDGSSIYPLLWGTTIGFIVQAISLRLLAGQADHIRVRPRLSFQSPQWAATIQALRVFTLGQIVLCTAAPLDQYFLAHVGDGAIATLGYANRVLSLLLSMGALAIGRATLPILSDIISRGDPIRARHTALKWVLLMLAMGGACAAVSWLLAPTVVGLLFQRGAFTGHDTAAVASIFRWGLLQVPFYFGVLVMMQLYASEGRYRSMAMIALLSFMLKAIGNILLIPWLGIAGVLISTALMHAGSFVLYLGFSRSRS